MKKIIILSLSMLLIYGCSTNSNGSGNTTTTVVPAAPSNLSGAVASSSQINLSWTDNSTNETEFKVERKTGSATFTAVGSTTTNVTTFNDNGLTPGISYTYRVYAVNSAGNSLTYSNEFTLNTASAINLPTLTTTAVASIATTTAVSGGTITNDGGTAITARGVCWSTSANPTISLPTKTTDGSGLGTFTSAISGLSANTTYYIRAYATNNTGTAYGNEFSFSTTTSSITTITDIEGNTYQTVQICNQIWTKSNLNVSRYTDGTIIPQVTDPTAWANLTTGAWCYYNNNPANGDIYGKLYNWYAVAGIYNAASLANPTLRKKLAPLGWHVPTDVEWTSLTDCLGGDSIAGQKMKSTTLWTLGNGFTNSNTSGFTVLPGGSRSNTDLLSDPIGDYGDFWSSSESSTATSWSRSLYCYSNSVFRISWNRAFGFSVRCIKD